MFDLASVKSSLHGRERREQRQIDKSDAKLARRYGIAELAGKSATAGRGGVAKKYTFKGSVFVLSNQQEITCYHSSDYASPFSGTRVTLPTLYPMESAGCTDESLALHRSLKRKLAKAAPSLSVPHTIFCVSMSSLMRQDDVNGARCRSDAIWAALARGILPLHDLSEGGDAPGLDSPSHSGRPGLVSVLALVDSEVRVVLKHEPVDYVLYNRLLSLRADWATLRPQGHAAVDDALFRAIHSLVLPGNDALEQPQCPSDHRDSSGGTSVVFIGSDDVRFSEEASDDPQWLRRGATRLVGHGGLRRVAGIALGDDSDAASTLCSLIHAFDDVGVNSVVVCGMKRVPLELESLIESVAELMVPSSRPNTSKASFDTTETEDRSTESSVVTSSAKWLLGVIEKVYLWSEVAGAMAPLVDRRCASCWALISRSSNEVETFVGAPRSRPSEGRSGWLCASCEARYYCVDCMNRFTLHLGSAECDALRRERQSGGILPLPPSRPGELSTPPSFRIEIEDTQSAAAVVFGGQKLRYVSHSEPEVSSKSRCIENESPGPAMICHKIGHGHWEDVDQAVRRHYEMVCRFHAIAERITTAFSEQCAEQTARTRSGSLTALCNQRCAQVSAQKALILEVKGGAGSGCYFVSENPNHAPLKVQPSNLALDDVETLEALGHYAARVHRFPLLVSKVVRSKDDGAILVTDLVVQHSEAACQQALEGFLRSHSCNRICTLLKSPDAKDAKMLWRLG